MDDNKKDYSRGISNIQYWFTICYLIVNGFGLLITIIYALYMEYKEQQLLNNDKNNKMNAQIRIGSGNDAKIADLIVAKSVSPPESPSMIHLLHLNYFLFVFCLYFVYIINILYPKQVTKILIKSLYLEMEEILIVMQILIIIIEKNAMVVDNYGNVFKNIDQFILQQLYILVMY